LIQLLIEVECLDGVRAGEAGGCKSPANLYKALKIGSQAVFLSKLVFFQEITKFACRDAVVPAICALFLRAGAGSGGWARGV
jgi:hypothetical protein